MGNQAVRELYERGELQAKLTVSGQRDPAEREAERVASQVMRTDNEGIPSTSDGDNGEKVDRIKEESGGVGTVSVNQFDQGIVEGETESKVRQGVGGVGKPLPTTTRAFFESRMGIAIPHVRLHTGPDANNAAESINAMAFTMGSDIAFGKGQYALESSSGKRLLAHELTHVVQQDTSRETVQTQASGGSRIPQRTPESSGDDSLNVASGVSGRYEGLPSGELVSREEEPPQSMSDPNLWCSDLQEFVEYEQQYGRLNTILEYNPVNNDLLPGLNYAIPSVYGLVDVDWMLRLSYTQIGTILPSLISPSVAEGMGIISSHIHYFAAKSFWNTLRSGGTAAMNVFGDLSEDEVIAFELDSLLQDANLNAPSVVVNWVHGVETLEEIFEPALEVCEEQ